MSGQLPSGVRFGWHLGRKLALLTLSVLYQLSVGTGESSTTTYRRFQFSLPDTIDPVAPSFLPPLDFSTHASRITPMSLPADEL